MKTWDQLMRITIVGVISLLFMMSMTSAAEFITDNTDTENCISNPTSSWTVSDFGNNYKVSKLYALKGDGSKTVTFITKVPKGRYNVRAWINNSLYASDAHYTVIHSSGTTNLIRNQSNCAGEWPIDLGTYLFDGVGKVIVNNYFTGPEKYVVADAVRYMEVSTTNIVWTTRNPQEALSQATIENKPILMYFGTDKSAECQRMNEETFKNSTLVKWSEKFVTVNVKGEDNPEVLRAYGIFRVPSILILSPNGVEKERIEGFQTADYLVKELNTLLSMFPTQ
jgi:hypothetical protein